MARYYIDNISNQTCSTTFHLIGGIEQESSKSSFSTSSNFRTEEAYLNYHETININQSLELAQLNPYCIDNQTITYNFIQDTGIPIIKSATANILKSESFNPIVNHIKLLLSLIYTNTIYFLGTQIISYIGQNKEYEETVEKANKSFKDLGDTYINKTTDLIIRKIDDWADPYQQLWQPEIASNASSCKNLLIGRTTDNEEQSNNSTLL